MRGVSQLLLTSHDWGFVLLLLLLCKVLTLDFALSHAGLFYIDLDIGVSEIRGTLLRSL